MGKTFLNIVLTVVAVAAITFVAAPLFAFRALKAAAQYQDVAAIAELIDFPATRLALTRQLEDRAAPAPATAEPPSIWRDPLGVFRQAIRPLAPPEPKVDKYLTVDGLFALTHGYRPGAAPARAPAPPLAQRMKTAALGPHATLVYWDPGRARVGIRRPGEPDRQTVFTWQRRGWFTWRLVAITLPPGEG